MAMNNKKGKLEQQLAEMEKLKRLLAFFKKSPIVVNERIKTQDVKIYRKEVNEFVSGIRGIYLNKDTNTYFELNRSKKNGGIREVIEHDYKDFAHLISIKHIPEIIEKSVYVTSMANEDVKVDVSFFDYFLCQMIINGTPYVVKSVIITLANGKRYYDHKITKGEAATIFQIVNKKNGPKSSSITSKPSNEPFLNQCKDKRLLTIMQINKDLINGQIKIQI